MATRYVSRDEPDRQPLVSLHDVTRVFDPQTNAGISHLSLTVWPGEFIAIVGPSGAGKSTLLNILGLLDRVDAGTYRLNGVDTAELSERGRDRLRSHTVGFVFQSSYVLGDDDAVTNAALGLRIQSVPIRQRTALAWEALDKVGLAARVRGPARFYSGGEPCHCPSTCHSASARSRG